MRRGERRVRRAVSEAVNLALEDVAMSCVDDLLHLPGVRAASLAMLRGPEDELHRIASGGDPGARNADGASSGHVLIDGESAAERAVRLNAPVMVPDQAPADNVGSLDERFVALPLSTGDRPVGVASVWLEGPTAFDPATLALVSGICRYTAKNLVRAERYERESRLQSIAARLSSARTLNEIGRLVVDHVGRCLSADACVWIDRDPDGMPTTIAQGGRPSQLIDHWKSFGGSGDILPVDGPAEVVPVLATITHTADNPADSWARYAGTIPMSGSGTVGVVFGSPVAWTAEDIAELVAMTQIVTQARERAQLYESVVRSHRHAERMGALTERLAGLQSIDEIAATVVQQTADAIGSHGGALGLTGDDGMMEWVARNGQPDVLLPASASTPGIVADVIEHRRAVFLPDLAATFWRFPQTARTITGSGVEAIAAIPLAVRDSVLGAAVFTFGEAQPFRADRRAFLAVVARVASVSLERARLHQDMEAQRNEQRAARNRAEFLVELVGRLDATHGFRERIRELLIGLVPRFADFGSIELLGDGGIDLADAEHRDPQLLPVLKTLRRNHRLASEHEGSTGDVAERGITTVRLLTSADYAKFTSDPDVLALLHRLAPRSVITVPLGPPGRRIGALLIGRSETGPEPFTDAEVHAIEELAQQVGLSLENARLFERSSQVAQELQSRMLAPEPIQLPGLTLASHYLPAVGDLQVGGDWFEALELTDGRVGLFVGDVVGRGLGAASAMGQLRAGLSALALTCDEPAELLLRLAHFAENVQGAACATVFIGILDRHTGDFRYVTAGHPPPLVVAPDGTTRLLEGGRSVPLTVSTERPVVEAQTNIPPGARLVLYTDGLVERKRESLDDGFARLAETASRLRHLDAGTFVTSLADEMVLPTGRADDTAVLCVDRSPAEQAPFLWRSTSGPSALEDLMSRLRAWLDARGVMAGDQDDVVRAVGETARSTIEASTDGGESHAPVEVEAVRDGDLLTLRVRNYEAWTNVPAAGTRGGGAGSGGAAINRTIQRSLSGTVVTLTRTLVSPTADPVP